MSKENDQYDKIIKSGEIDMKKMTLLFILALLLTSLQSQSWGYSLVIVPHQGSLDVIPGSSTVSFDIIFHPDSGTQFGNWAFNLYYDTSEITWNSSLTTAGAIPAPLVSALFGGPSENTPGLIENFSGLLSPPNAVAPNISDNITLATVVFDVNTASEDGGDDVWLDKNSKIHFLLDGNPVPTSALPVVAGMDSDGDGILDDGDLSGTVGDNACIDGNTSNCDDNCIFTPNPGQEETNSLEDDNTLLSGTQHYGIACDCDLDNNGSVGGNDFNIFKNAWLSNSSSPNWNPHADFDQNGGIGGNDFNILKGKWLTSAPW